MKHFTLSLFFSFLLPAWMLLGSVSAQAQTPVDAQSADQPGNARKFVWRTDKRGWQLTDGWSKPVSQEIYEIVFPFHEKDQLALVIGQSWWKFIDRDGKEVHSLDIKHHVGAEFIWALIDSWGGIHSHDQFSDISKEAKDGFFTFTQQKTYVDPLHDVPVTYNKYGLINRKGVLIGDDEYCLLTWEGTHWRVAREPAFTDGRIAVARVTHPDKEVAMGQLIRQGTLYGFEKDVQYGYMDTLGNLLCIGYDRIYPFIDDKAIVAFDNPYNSPDQRYEYGYINNQGEEIIRPQFREAEPFDGALALVSPYGSDFRALINLQGERVTDSLHRVRKCSKEIWISEFAGGSHFSYIDAKTGKRLSRFYAHMECPRTDGMPTPVMLINGRAATYIIGKGKIEKKWGYVDSRGQEIVPVVFDAVTHFESNGVGMVTQGRKRRQVNAQGEFIPED